MEARAQIWRESLRGSNTKDSSVAVWAARRWWAVGKGRGFSSWSRGAGLGPPPAIVQVERRVARPISTTASYTLGEDKVGRRLLGQSGRRHLT